MPSRRVLGYMGEYDYEECTCGAWQTGLVNKRDSTSWKPVTDGKKARFPGGA